jgi:hypothetical protein
MMERMEKNQNECRFGFVGVFLLGLLGIWMTGKYYLKREDAVEREARNRRVATEVQRFHDTEKSAMTAIRGR